MTSETEGERRHGRHLSVQGSDSLRKRSKSRHRDKEKDNGKDKDRDRDRDRDRDKSRVRDNGEKTEKRRDRSSSFLNVLGDGDRRSKDRSRSRHRSGTLEVDESARHGTRDRSRTRHGGSGEKEQDREGRDKKKEKKERDKDKDKDSRRGKKDKDKKRKELTVDTTATSLEPSAASRPSPSTPEASYDEDDGDYDDYDAGTPTEKSRGMTPGAPTTTDRSFNPNVSNNFTYDYHPSPYMGPSPSKPGEYSPVSPISTSAPFSHYPSHPPPPPQNTTSFPPTSSQPPAPAPYPHTPAPGQFAIPHSPFPPPNEVSNPPSEMSYEYQIPPPPLPPLPPGPYPLTATPHPFSPTLGTPPPPPPGHLASPAQPAHPLPPGQPQYEYQIPPPPPPPPPPPGQYGVPQQQQPYAHHSSSTPPLQSPYGTSGTYDYQSPPLPTGFFAPQSYDQQQQHLPPLPPKPPIPEIEGENPDYAPNEHINPAYWQQAESGIGLHHPPSSSSMPPPPPLSPDLGPHHSAPSPPIGPHFTAFPQSPPHTSSGYGALQSPTSPTTGTGHHSHHNSLTIPGQLAGLSINTGGASPMMQPYHGTYQSISPMPSPLFGPTPSSPYSPPGQLPSNFSLGAPLMSPPPLPPKLNRPEKKEEKYDPLPHAKTLLSALNRVISRVDTQPIIEILPKLTPSQLVALRAEYKKLYHQVNIAKHIKMQVGGPLGKIAWAVALGPYESEGWWANSWYQKAVTRNELLIEAIVGKSVQETRLIKKGFKDGKYGNSLEKAVKAELEAQKFRTLILMCLNTEEGVREEEPEDEGYLGSVQGTLVVNPGVVDFGKVKEDVAKLFDVLRMRPGTGENVLMEVCVCRSDVHLREVIRWYRQMHGKDLAKGVLGHSENLVGEALVHRLMGLIDRPLRDAKLLEAAMVGVRKGSGLGSGGEGGALRDVDLFVSRIVRVHWDKDHLERVKGAFAVKYKMNLLNRVEGVLAGSGTEVRELREFVVRMLGGY